MYMTLQQFGLSYPYFGGSFLNTGKSYWTREEIKECLTRLNDECSFDGCDFNANQTPTEIEWWGVKYLRYEGFWTKSIAFPIEPSSNLYLLDTPRTRKEVDDYTNWLVNYYLELRKENG